MIRTIPTPHSLHAATQTPAIKRTAILAPTRPAAARPAATIPAATAYSTPATPATGTSQYAAAVALANLVGGAGTSSSSGRQGQNPPGYAFSTAAGYWTPVSGSGPGLVWNAQTSSFVPYNGSNGADPGYLAQLASLASSPATAPRAIMQSAATTPAAPAAPVMQSATTTPAATTTSTATSATAPTTSNTSSLLVTADMEVIENEMYLYGDTWDDAETILNELYAAGVAPGTVTTAMALQYMTGIGTTAAATTTSTTVLTDPTTWPWYYWAAAGGAVLLMMSNKKGK